MVDATIGGKNGVNYNNTKNLLGCIRQPQEIHICTEYLKTLPKAELQSGLAEVAKIVYTYDKEFFEFLMSINYDEILQKHN